MRKKRTKNLKKRLLKVTIPFVVLLLFIYIMYQLVSGDKSIFTWMQLSAQVSDFEQKNANLETQKMLLETKVKRLNPNTLDEDFLDEQIRKSLPMVKPNDIIIFTHKKTGN